MSQHTRRTSERPQQPWLLSPAFERRLRQQAKARAREMEGSEREDIENGKPPAAPPKGNPSTSTTVETNQTEESGQPDGIRVRQADLTIEHLRDLVDDVQVTGADAFLASYFTTYDALSSIKEDLILHTNGKKPLTATTVGLLLNDLKEIQNKLSMLHQNSYQLFSARYYLDHHELSYQGIALHFYHELDQGYRAIRLRAAEIQEKLTLNKSTGLKPPKLTVPKFTGNHADWPQFKNNFTNLTTALPPVDKLRLLQDAIRNHEAADTIKDLDITEVNWPIAWSRMVTRYDSPREIAHSAIRPLLELPGLMSQTEAGLHKLIAQVRTTRHQLQQVNLSGMSEADVLYLHLIQTRLDTRTMNEFNQTLTTSEIPSLDNCIQYLERKAKDVALTRELKQSSGNTHAPQRKGRDMERRRDIHHVSFKQKEPSVKTDNPRKSQTPSKPKGGKAKGDNGPKPRPGTQQFPCLICSKEGHRIQACPSYTNMTLTQKQEAVKKAKLCYSCLSPTHATRDCKSIFKCLICGGHHHTTLHQDKPQPTVATLFHCAAPKTSEGLIPTARIIIKANGKQIPARCMLDSGAQGSFILASLAKKLGLKSKTNGQNFGTVGHQSIQSAGTVNINVCSQNEDFEVNLEAHILPSLTTQQPGTYFTIDHWDHIKDLDLADPDFNQPGMIDMLIGLPLMDQIILSGKISGAPGQASAYNTYLGHVLMGGYHSSITLIQPAPAMESTSPISEEALDNLNTNIELFWKTETIPTPHPSSLWSEEEKFCENHFIQTTQRLENGRYQIKWPFIQDPSSLGSSVQMAHKRWLSMERKLWTQPELRENYNSQLQEYIDAGRMTKIPEHLIHTQSAYYIPHHAVFKPDSTSTKVRIVFDASAKTSSGLSLNSLLPAGPTIQPDLVRQLLHFRENPIAIQADITKMYLQIMVDPQHRDFIRILWRPDSNKPITHYQLNVVPFGVSVSPFIACRTLAQLAQDGEKDFPLGAATLKNRFYVDNLTTSIEDLSTAIEMKTQITELLHSAGFPLCKWASNSKEFMETIPPPLRESGDQLDLDESATIKALGLFWSPSSDTFAYQCNLDLSRKPTKRNVLSEISKIFDPLGFLGPVVIRAKIMMQKIWTQSLGWDDLLPDTLVAEWLETATTLNYVTTIKIPRALRTCKEEQLELHGFADASQDAYAACIYLRTISGSRIDTKLVIAKTRVAPLKSLTIPRLELQGALLLTELMSTVQNSLAIPNSHIFYWTDSAITLHWLLASPQKWKTFVRNRVAAIQETSLKTQWAHVISEENPADCASRGLLPQDLESHFLWWNGPSWLRNQSIIQPPVPGVSPDITEMETTKPKILTINGPSEITFVEHLSRIGSWHKTIRILARIHLILRRKTFCSPQAPAPADLISAEKTLCRLIQLDAFPELIEGCKVSVDPEEPAPRIKSKGLRNLLPTRHLDGVIRVGGRLQQSGLPFDTQHPIILPGTSELVKSLIMHTHLILAHAGARVILNHLRQKFWIVNGKKHIKSIIDKCLICFRYQCRPETQLIGQLPSARVNLVRPFLHTGVDLAGPYLLRNISGRGRHFKVWICLFTCMATRAIHLEIVSSLSAEGFLLAFRRFMARRGKPSHMYSDNGTNFVGANHHLQDHVEHLHNALQQGHITLPGMELDKIHWVFSPPQGPHHGGTWEICVKLVKQHLKTQCEIINFNWEEFETLLLSIEAIVNSRPLTPMDDDPQSLEALTPGHFLIGTPLLTAPEADITHLKLNRLNQYQLVIRRFQELWKRWYRDYLTELQKSQKWLRSRSNLQVGDMVLILDDRMPPLAWRTGRIQKVHPGRDNLVRVATIEVATSTPTKDREAPAVTKKEVTRPISKLAKLPVDTASVLPPHTSINHLHRTPSVPLAQWLVIGVLFSTMNGANAQSPNMLGQEARWTVAAAAMFCAISGVMCNLAAIIGWFLRRTNGRRRSEYSYCIFSLHLSDLTIAGFLIPLTASRFYFNEWTLGEPLCRIYSLVLYGSVTWTLLNLITIACFRYLRVVHMKHRLSPLTTTVKATLIMLPILSYTLPALAFLGIYGTIDQNPHDNTTCTIMPDDMGRSPKPYIWMIGVVTPFSIIYISMCFLYWTVWRQSRKWKATPSSWTAHIRLRKVITKVWISFLLGYQPILILNIVDGTKTSLSPMFHLIALFLAWSTTFIHPLVYQPSRLRQRSSLAPPKLRTSCMTMSVVEDKKRPLAPATISTAPHWKNNWIYTTTLVFTLITCAGATITNKVPATVSQLPACSTSGLPILPVPPCTATAFWIEVQQDASACLQTQKCLVDSNQYVRADATGCDDPHRSCDEVTTRLVDNLVCQTRDHLPSNIASHIALRNLLPNLCTVGNLHLHSCNDFTDVIQEIPVVMIKGIIYPLQELHLIEDALLSNMSSYNCSCNPQECVKQQCHGDTTFCAHIGCITDLPDEDPCFCKVANLPPAQALQTPAGNIYPDCWGHLFLPTKVPVPPTSPEKSCATCTVSCTTTGIDVHTPHMTPSYIKASKNPGHVSITPTSEKTSIPFTPQMLISHGTINLDLWLPEADSPIQLQTNCPRISVCLAISCHLCYDRWVNIKCYTYINWTILGGGTFIIISIILFLRYLISITRACIWCTCWPLRRLWKANYRRRNRQQPDEETGIDIPLVTSPHPYDRPLVTTRHRPPFWTLNPYKGPLVILTCLGLLLNQSSPAYGCAEFASLSASSTECRLQDNKEHCNLRINTRMEVSPVGQRSCFKISNQRHPVIGTIELQTKSISIQCNKQLLYYVPRAKINCQSHIQCYSLYSSSDCNGGKCQSFLINSTIPAFHSTKDNIGWSSCLGIRYPTCPWWLTRDCHFYRTALINPTQEIYEVFNCPEWQYAVSLQIKMTMTNPPRSTEIILQAGEPKQYENITFQLISASVPPTPLLNQCFIRKDKKIAISPCNDRGEIAPGRLGEIQCNSPEEASKAKNTCQTSRSLITVEADSMGIRCSGNMLDPEEILNIHPLPFRLDSGVLHPSNLTVELEATATSLLEIQLSATNLEIQSYIQEGTCKASFIKLEGCYSCLPGATLFLEARTDGTPSVMAFLECNSQLAYTQFEVNNLTTNHAIIIHADGPEVDTSCILKCSTSQITLHVKGHLHYLSNPTFQTTSLATSFQPPTSAGFGMDFHWMSLTGLGLFSWITRGIIAISIIAIIIISISLSVKISLAKKLL